MIGAIVVILLLTAAFTGLTVLSACILAGRTDRETEERNRV